MHVRHLRLIDFRSYSSVDVDLAPGVNVFVGPNGQGKTNLVEAIGYVATLGSHRVATDAPLIRSGAGRAQIRTAVVSDERELVVEIELIPGKSNQVKLNRSPVARPRSILGALRTVLFAPEDLSLVRGDPSERRRFIDDLLVARWPRFAGIRADYDRVLKQRNALLKSAGFTQRRRGAARRDSDSSSDASTDLRTLEVWDTHVAQYGSQLLAGRIATIAALAPHVEKAYQAVSDSVSLASIMYQSSLSDSDTAPAEPLATDPDVLNAQLLAALAQARSKELERGITLVGPHRDELLLKLGELPAKGYASHGESWSFALALRLACFELLRAEGIEPVLILDDVFAELDTSRRERLGELVSKGSQVLVTAAVAADLPRTLSAVDPGSARFDVAESQVRRVC